MNIFVITVYIIGLVVFISISSSTIFLILFNREKYGSAFAIILNLLILCFFGIIYPIFFLLSQIVYISKIENTFFLNLSIMVEIISLGFFSIGYASFKENKKYLVYFFTLFATLGGFSIGFLIQCSSCEINTINNTLFFTFSSSFSLSFFIFQSVGYGYLLFSAIKVHKISNFPLLSKGLLLFTILLGIPLLSLPFSFFLNISYLKEIHFFSLLSIMVMKFFTLWKKPHADNILTDKIYYINIYHKSGVLLFSYKFKQIKKVEIASEVWGNILIGINHILSEFIDTKGQINLLKTKNAEIIVNYNEQYSFAILAITNKKSRFLEKLLKNLEERLTEEYREELKEIKDINKIINVSEFRRVNEIIEDVFDIYL
jgi:predicted house-cleaning noncanonical NTP pyrophosphatase (MazG superfamily)